MNELDEFLSHPLPGVSDDGFSRHVMARVRTEQLRDQAITVVTVAACAILVILALPLHEIGAGLGVAITQVTHSVGIAAAAGAIVLTLVLERQLFRS